MTWQSKQENESGNMDMTPRAAQIRQEWHISASGPVVGPHHRKLSSNGKNGAHLGENGNATWAANMNRPTVTVRQDERPNGIKAIAAAPSSDKPKSSG